MALLFSYYETKGRAMNKSTGFIFNLCLAGVLLLTTDCQQELSVDSIITRCAAALSGRVHIKDVQSMRIHAVFPDHGSDAKVFEIQRPNRSCLPQARLMFDGLRACFLKGPTGDEKAQMVPAEEWPDFEVEIGFHFPAFFDYPATYTGTAIVDRRDYHKIRVELPLGAILTYFIDADTFLPAKVMAEFTTAGKKRTPHRDYFNYRETGGIFLPFAFTYGSRHGQIQGHVESYDLNPVFEDDYFAIPDSLFSKQEEKTGETR